MILSVVKCYIITGDCLFNLILNMVCGLIESYKTKENMLNPNKSDKRQNIDELNPLLSFKPRMYGNSKETSINSSLYLCRVLCTLL